MANVDAPRGFWPLKSLSGEIRTNQYIVTTGKTIYQGDPVFMVAAGTVQDAKASSSTGDELVGVAAHTVKDTSSTGGLTIQVYDDPHQEFGVQTISSTNYVATMVGNTCDHNLIAGSATKSLSKVEADIGTLGTASGGKAQMIILGLTGEPNNVASSSHANIRIRFNEHKFLGTAGGPI